MRYIWASPNTLLGVLVGLLAVFGGRARICRGALEFSGPAIGWGLSRLPGRGALALTLGHTVLGQTTATLDLCRDHEHVHVRQYERWGPFFIPAYLLASLWLLAHGRDAYRHNPFEREAYGDV